MSATNPAPTVDGANSPFGKVFAAYSKAFAEQDMHGLQIAFAPDARVVVRDRRTNKTLDLSPAEFFTQLYGEVGTAHFAVEQLISHFEDGYLFADGLWADSADNTTAGTPILRAADLFSAHPDGKIWSLDVVWTAP